MKIDYSIPNSSQGQTLSLPDVPNWQAARKALIKEVTEQLRQQQGHEPNEEDVKAELIKLAKLKTAGLVNTFDELFPSDVLIRNAESGDYIDWLVKPYWYAYEAAAIFQECVARRGGITYASDYGIERIKPFCDRLFNFDEGMPDALSPADWIEWAVQKGLTLPAALLPQASDAQEPQTLKVEAKQASAPVTTNKLRRNCLDPAIDKAIEQAGNMELADVWLKLKELALAEEKPFTGATKDGALCYTDDDDKPATLSKKDQFRKRLDTRKNAV